MSGEGLIFRLDSVLLFWLVTNVSVNWYRYRRSRHVILNTSQFPVNIPSVEILMEICNSIRNGTPSNRVGTFASLYFKF